MSYPTQADSNTDIRLAQLPSFDCDTRFDGLDEDEASSMDAEQLVECLNIDKGLFDGEGVRANEGGP